MQKKWILKNQPSLEIISSLSSILNVSTPIATLLAQRNILDFDSAKRFFRPSLEHLHNPFLMKDMDKAVQRLQHAIKTNEKVLIYGDYDVDGTTSVALVYSFLESHFGSENLEFYIPDRYAEGYGVSFQGIDYAAQNGFTLIISLDCGVKSIQQINYASAKTIDFIICDHHRTGDLLPDAFAILDPKREDCHYPYKELSGCGVGFKLMQALCIAEDIDMSTLFDYLDLVAISIASDIVDMMGENRVLAYYGIKRINEAPRPGIQALIEVGDLKGPLTTSHIVFGMAPRINAAGRIEHARDSVKLLIAKTPEEASRCAAKVNIKNIERRDVDLNITLEALAMIENDETLKNSKSTVLFKKDWSKGVIGIVASRCIEKYYRPTIILTESNNKAAGSARSVYGFDVYEAISECYDLLDQYGGHTYAAGLTLSLDKVEAFKEKFEKVVAARINDSHLNPPLNIDAILQLDEISLRFYQVLKQFAPFGPGNMQPVFMTERLKDTGKSKVVKEDHLKLKVKQTYNNSEFEGIGFNMGGFYPFLSNNTEFSLCYQVQENDFGGNTKLELLAKDIRFSHESTIYPSKLN